MPSTLPWSSPRAFSATGEDAPQSTSSVAFAVFEPEAGVEPAAGAEGIAAADNGEPHGHAPALGRADTSACQRRTFAHASGTESFAGFMKSIAIMPVMSATL